VMTLAARTPPATDVFPYIPFPPSYRFSSCRL
jgi:hypothetical protein